MWHFLQETQTDNTAKNDQNLILVLHKRSLLSQYP